MTKTAKKNEIAIVEEEESTAFKKRRMKEVRAMVARAVKNNQRVDLMGLEGTDIPRAMIALQDLLSKSQERHRKATSHVAAFNRLREMTRWTLGLSSRSLIILHKANIELQEELDEERRRHQMTAEVLQELNHQTGLLQNDLDTVKRAGEIING
jgi:hypothetical protein